MLTIDTSLLCSKKKILDAFACVFMRKLRLYKSNPNSKPVHLSRVSLHLSKCIFTLLDFLFIKTTI